MVSAPPPHTPSSFAFPLFTWSNDARVRIHRRANRKGGQIWTAAVQTNLPWNGARESAQAQACSGGRGCADNMSDWWKIKGSSAPNKGLKVPRPNKHRAKCDGVFFVDATMMDWKHSCLRRGSTPLLCGSVSICSYLIYFTSIHPQRETQDIWNLALKFRRETIKILIKEGKMRATAATRRLLDVNKEFRNGNPARRKDKG